ncbi:DUF373 family protein [Methanofollis aquaemaris]|uniref:DUF373 family protein n=1 Tax=Methanofollis aquaemaris TaxID=126734 RepID=A0A8A3S3K4_9EURY|nr:DUF373 family protein [Methanofollis aquaemaris]QSZ66459.1 DUF373 family protein [Methanofollis aquaemaris]
MADGTTLILCVDRDDDLGFKANVKSPVVGREACLKAAEALGLADPEDSDVNAIFQAVKTYDALVEKGEEVEVALLAGDHMHMLEGDRKIAADLMGVVDSTGAESCILISDGAEDEYVLPVVQSRMVVSGVQRVIVTQMPNLEGTYYIIKKLLDDPKVARMVLIPLGLAMLIYATAYLIGYPEGATIIVVGALGLYLLFKGLGMDEFFSYSINSLQTALHRGRITFVSYIAAILFVIVGIIIGLNSLLAYYTEEGLLLHILTFAFGAIGWFTVAGLTASIGKIIDVYLHEIVDLGKVIVLPFFIGAIGIIVYGISIYMLSISMIKDFPFEEIAGVEWAVYSMVAGLFLAFVGVYIQSLINRWIEKKGSQLPHPEGRSL